MDQPEFTLSEVACAADVPAGTLNSWLNRAENDWSAKDRGGALALLAPDLMPTEHGLSRNSARLFSRRSAYRIATLRELNRFGMSPAEGIRYAALATDRQLHGRSETLLFSEGFTILMVDASGTAAVLNFIDADSKSYIDDPLPNGTGTDVRVDLVRLFDRVDRKLGIKKAA